MEARRHPPYVLLDLLKCALMVHPTERVTQVIVNACGEKDPFHVEDEELEAKLVEYINKGE